MLEVFAQKSVLLETVVVAFYRVDHFDIFVSQRTDSNQDSRVCTRQQLND